MIAVSSCVVACLAVASGTAPGQADAPANSWIDLLQTHANIVQEEQRDAKPATGNNFYVLGKGNGCPDNYAKIRAPEDCKTAAGVLSLGSLERPQHYDRHPAGCHTNENGQVFLNTAPQGFPSTDLKPICKLERANNVAAATSVRNPEEAPSTRLVTSGAEVKLYEFGTGNNCPDNYHSVKDADVCKRAAAALGLASLKQSHDWTDHPGGCHTNSKGQVFLNTAAKGKASEGLRPICVFRKFYVLGTGNGCPVNYHVVREHAVCKTAGEALKLGALKQSHSWADHPGGCHTNENGNVFLNTAAKGVASEGLRPVCAWSCGADGCGQDDEASNDDKNDGHALRDFHVVAATGTAEEHKSRFVAAAKGVGVCPKGFKVIGDPRTCKSAMNSLGYDKWGHQDSWEKKPSGCHATPDGVVNLNNNSGSSDGSKATIICEQDVKTGAANLYEARDSLGEWLPITIRAKNSDGTYVAALSDNSEWEQVLQFNVRLIDEESATGTSSAPGTGGGKNAGMEIRKGKQHGALQATVYGASVVQSEGVGRVGKAGKKAWKNEAKAAQKNADSNTQKAASHASGGVDIRKWSIFRKSSARELIRRTLSKDEWAEFCQVHKVPRGILKKEILQGKRPAFQQSSIKAAREAYVKAGKQPTMVDKFLKSVAKGATPEQALDLWHQTMKNDNHA